jgi:hypothetical protein
VLPEGIEPSILTEPELKPDVYANFTTGALFKKKHWKGGEVASLKFTGSRIFQA